MVKTPRPVRDPAPGAAAPAKAKPSGARSPLSDLVPKSGVLAHDWSRSPRLEPNAGHTPSTACVLPADCRAVVQTAQGTAALEVHVTTLTAE